MNLKKKKTSQPENSLAECYKIVDSTRAVRSAIKRPTKSVELFLETPIGSLRGDGRPMWELPRRVCGYYIHRELGRGAFATVYQATDEDLGREVALKVSSGEGLEAQTLASLEHDHIVKVFTEMAANKNGIRLLSMQLVVGTSLEKLLPDLSGAPDGQRVLDRIDSRLEVQSGMDSTGIKFRQYFSELDYRSMCLWIGARLAAALHYAHSKGVLHLDIKPGNVLISQTGRPYLADFNVSMDQKRNQRQVLGGTFRYMSPEQRSFFDGVKETDTVDARSDIFSLGVVIRELFEKGGVSLPEIVKNILDHATKPKKEDRFETAAQLGQAFDHARQLLNVQESLPNRGFWIRWFEKYPLLSITILGAIPQVAASAVGLLYNQLKIVSELSPDQRDVFFSLNQTFVPFVYGIALFLWGLYCLRIDRAFIQLKKGEAIDKNQLKCWVLGIPRLGIAFNTTSWVSAAILVPLAIHLWAEHLASNIIAHFCFSFFASWHISLGYTYIIQVFLVLRTLYGQVTLESKPLAEQAKKELSGFDISIRRVQALLFIIPLWGASMLLFTGPGDLSPDIYRVFSLLVGSLIGLGAIGSFLGNSLSHRISRMISLFQEPENQLRRVKKGPVDYQY